MIGEFVVAGQVALVELVDDDDATHPSTGPSLTGLVGADPTGQVVIDLGQGADDGLDGHAVVASIFAPDALYKVRGRAQHYGLGSICVDPVETVERIQRRRWPRHAMQLTVTLAPVDGADADFIGVTGRTMDIGMGGLRAHTLRQLRPGADPTVIVTLPDGSTLAIASRVVSTDIGDDGCEYRLAFGAMEDGDARRLAALLRSA